MDKLSLGKIELETMADQLLDVKEFNYTDSPPVRLKGDKFLNFVTEDLEEFLESFSQLKSFDFDDFLKIWKEKSMPYIFSGRSSEWEMEFFTERTLIFVKDLLVNRRSNFERIGALYLLYILYFSQPLVNKVKIRVEHSDMKELLKFIKEILRSDVAYAFVRLCSKRAFSFVASSLPRSTESGEPQVDSDEEVETDNVLIKRDILNEINAHRAIKKNNKYREVLSKLSEFDGSNKTKFENSCGELFKQQLYQPAFSQKSEKEIRGPLRNKTTEFMDQLAGGFSGVADSEEEENEGDLFLGPTHNFSDSSDGSLLSNDEEDTNSSSSGNSTDDSDSNSSSPGDDTEFGVKNSDCDDVNYHKDETKGKRSKPSKSNSTASKKMKCVGDIVEKK